MPNSHSEHPAFDVLADKLFPMDNAVVIRASNDSVFEKRKGRAINLYAGPGCGKSTTMAALFAEAKYLGWNTEIITEYAKDAAWEKRSTKFFAAQDYIFGKQHFRMSRVIHETDFVITDSPLLQNIVYGKGFHLPALEPMIRQAYDLYDNLDIYLIRSEKKVYNPKGRYQTEDQAKEKDVEILNLLIDQKIDFHTMVFGRENVQEILNLMRKKEWI